MALSNIDIDGRDAKDMNLASSLYQEGSGSIRYWSYVDGQTRSQVPPDTFGNAGPDTIRGGVPVGGVTLSGFPFPDVLRTSYHNGYYWNPPANPFSDGQIGDRRYTWSGTESTNGLTANTVGAWALQPSIPTNYIGELSTSPLYESAG